MATNEFEQHSEKMEPIFPVNTSYIPDYIKERAEDELSEDEEIKVNSLQLLRSMLRDEAQFTWQDEDLFLLAFLRTRKYDISRSFQLAKNFYTVLDKYSELFHNFDFNRVRKTLQCMKIGLLPYRDREGCPILVYRLAPWDPKVNSMGDNVLAINCLFHLAIRSPATQIAGLKMIVDCNGFSIKHIPHISLSYIWFSAQALQNSMPFRSRAVHVVNEGNVFCLIWAVIKQFLSKKMKERWHFHGNNVKKLHKYFSPSILPADYEGEMPPFENSCNLKEAEEHTDYLNHVFSFGFQKD